MTLEEKAVEIARHLACSFDGDVFYQDNDSVPSGRIYDPADVIAEALRQAVAEEREACASIADERAAFHEQNQTDAGRETSAAMFKGAASCATAIAEVIRARQTPGGREIIVGKGGAATIAEAIAEAGPGDTIRVYSTTGKSSRSE